YVIGSTGSSNFPVTAGAFQTTLGSGSPHAFVAKISDSSACTLACAAKAPSNGTIDLPISFVATSITSGCAGFPELTYDWDFGDGSAHSSQPNPKHIYTAVGTYTWTITAYLPGTSPCVKTGTILVSTSCTAPSIT